MYMRPPVRSELAFDVDHIQPDDSRIHQLDNTARESVQRAFFLKKQLAQASYAYYRSSSPQDQHKLEQILHRFMPLLSGMANDMFLSNRVGHKWTSLVDDVTESAQQIFDLLSMEDADAAHFIETRTDAFVYNAHALISLYVLSHDQHL
jgi:hypothetical protein